jgi:hypothetical protein
MTQSTDFPTTTNAFRGVPRSRDDGFVARLDLSRSGNDQLSYSTYFGGNDRDGIRDVDVTTDGRLAIAGNSSSTDLPTSPGAYASIRFPGGYSDGFVAVLDPARPPVTQLLYGTYLGGRYHDYAERVILLADGTLVIAGETDSDNMNPSPGAFQASGGGGDGYAEAFLAILDPSQFGMSQRVYLTYLGGSGRLYTEEVYGLARLRSGMLAIAGGTLAPHFPTTAGALDRTFGGGQPYYDHDGFFSLLDPARVGQEQLVYSTFIGGPGSDICRGLQVDDAGIVTLSCTTTSLAGLPTTSDAPFPRALGEFDVFVLQLDVVRRSFLFGSYFGGPGSEGNLDVAVDDLGRVIVTGGAADPGMPVTPDAYDGTPNGEGDCFITMLDTLPTGVELFGRPSAGCEGTVLLRASSIPNVQNEEFMLLCSRAPAASSGIALFSAGRLTTPVRFADVDLFVDLTQATFLITSSTPSGRSELALPIPGDKTLAGRKLYAQVVWIEPAGPPPCPPQRLSASPAVEITLQL